ncbi:MAG: spermidine dehydrogenase [Halioglobus sp.]|jgi:spermidine dehydrogenase
MSGIKRRDFINGTLVAAGSSLLNYGVASQGAMAALTPSYYPPSLTGLRGSHPGSNTHAHALAWKQRTDWEPTAKGAEAYDLVVVGGGLSGLSAAYFYQQKYGADKTVLILDNHDDFGGHAKRNEHSINGNTLISYGGSQSLVEPLNADKVISDLFEDIGVDLNRFNTAYDTDFFRRHNLGSVTYFSKAVFGEDKVVRHPFCNYPNYIEGLLGAKISNEEAAQQAPLSARGKEQLLRVLNGGLHKIAVPAEQLQDYISTHSYFDYLKTTLGVDDPGVLRMARNSGLDWASASAELLSIEAAKVAGALGFEAVPVYDENNPYIHHFPDGNAGVARALVKKLIPSVAKGGNAEELILSKFDYDQLDRVNNQVRIRLNSTVVKVQHFGKSDSASEVLVNYANNDGVHTIKAKSVVMACYNMIIPHIVAGLPETQAAALKLQTKSPLQYTTVGLKNWRALKEMEIGMAMSPGNMHQAVLMDFPVSIGGYEYTKTPDDPCVIQMISCPYGKTVGAPKLDQFREARYRMLGLQFEDYEKEIRNHLSGMLPATSFNFDSDVASISVNRWGHGYTVAGPGDSTAVGRQAFGRITIANCDSAPGADAQTAIMMASRAVDELG